MELNEMIKFLGKKFKKAGQKHIILTVDNIYTISDIQGNIIKRYFVAYTETNNQKKYDFDFFGVEV